MNTNSPKELLNCQQKNCNLNLEVDFLIEIQFLKTIHKLFCAYFLRLKPIQTSKSYKNDVYYCFKPYF